MSLAGWIQVSTLRAPAGVSRDHVSPMAMCGLPVPSLVDGRYDPSQHEDALTVWFWAAYLTVTDKRGISALLLQRQLGLSRYETAWMLLHKLRRAMVNAARESLHGDVEIDDTLVPLVYDELHHLAASRLRNEPAAVGREWNVAKAWLFRELTR